MIPKRSSYSVNQRKTDSTLAQKKDKQRSIKHYKTKDRAVRTPL